MQKMGELFSLYDEKWGLPTPSPKACVSYLSLRRPPYELGQNGSQISRTYYKIFGGTFFFFILYW